MPVQTRLSDDYHAVIRLLYTSVGYIVNMKRKGDPMSNYHKTSYTHVTHVQLKVLHLEEMSAFYQTVIGLKILNQDKEHIQLSADGVTILVTLVHRDSFIPKPSGRTGLYHVALLMPDRVQLGLFLKNLQQTSYPLIGASHHGVSEALYLEDPEGNGIEIYADTPDKTWARHEDDHQQLEMVTRRLDLDSLLKAAEGTEWTGAPTEMIMGHIHLHVADLQEAESFYGALGFSLVQTIPGQATFVSTGGYHHHIGFNVWNGEGAPAPPENSAGMDFFTLLFPDNKTLDTALEDTAALGHKADHDNGDIYLHDPSTNLIQCRVAGK